MKVFLVLLLGGAIQFCFCSKQKSSSSSSPSKTTERFNRFITRAEKLIPPSSFIPDPLSPRQHHNVSTAVFSVGIMPNSMPIYSKFFLGTLRKTGFDGDIVVAFHQDISEGVLEALLKHNPVLYRPTYSCIELSKTDTRCEIEGQTGPSLTIHMMRYYMYLWWASKYQKHTLILLADFRDVFFQSNPFNYMTSLWSPPAAHLAVFLEALPMKVSGYQLFFEILMNSFE